MTSLVVLQSNYIPWRGYFDLINDADVFVFYDDVQFTKNDWRNRNRVKTERGLLWLSVPVGSNLKRRICDVDIESSTWQEKHLATLKHCYSKAPHFSRYSDLLHQLYVETRWTSLSELNQSSIRMIAELLGTDTHFLDSRSTTATGARQERLINLAKEVGADKYISGPSAKSYLDEQLFMENGISVVWKDYAGYPEYPQLFKPFEHSVSILDLLFNVGPAASQKIWGWRTSQ